MNLVAALMALVPVLTPALLIPPDQRAVASELARLEAFMPTTALSALVTGPEDEVAGYVPGDTRYRDTRDGELQRSWIGRDLTARGVAETDVPWAILFAMRRRHRGEPVGLDLLAAAARGPHPRFRTSWRATTRDGGIVEADALEIVDTVRFDKDGARPSAGEALLDAIAATVIANPGLSLLEVRGHAGADERGAEALAHRRALAVRDALIRRGVAGERLVAAAAVTPAAAARQSRDAPRFVELLNIRVGPAGP
jgi:outer membrane protein OmpA-like peptidoglycan-associated protein